MMTKFKRLEKLVYEQLKPYLSLGPAYQKTKTDVRTLFPKSLRPESALHHGVCFAEELMHMIDSRYFEQPWVCPIPQIQSSHYARMENMFSRVINLFEKMLCADSGDVPFMDYNFLAGDLSRYLEVAAKTINLAINDSPELDAFRDVPPLEYSKEMLAIVRGQALGRRGEYVVNYVACFGGNTLENALTLMRLLKTQLEFALKDNYATDLGVRIHTLLSNEEFCNFIAERYAAGINWSLATIEENWHSPAWYFVYYGWWGMYRSATNISYDNVGTMGLRITDLDGWRDYIKVVNSP